MSDLATIATHLPASVSTGWALAVVDENDAVCSFEHHETLIRASIAMMKMGWKHPGTRAIMFEVSEILDFWVDASIP